MIRHDHDICCEHARTAYNAALLHVYVCNTSICMHAYAVIMYVIMYYYINEQIID